MVEELTGTVDPNDIPTLVVYERDGGLTDEDLAAMDEQAAEIAKIDGVDTDEGRDHTQRARRRRPPRARPVPHLLSDDGEVAYSGVHVQLRQGRLERHP